MTGGAAPAARRDGVVRRLGLTTNGYGLDGHIDFLRDIGCAEVQGFYFGSPIPAAEVADLWTKPVLAVSSWTLH